MEMGPGVAKDQIIDLVRLIQPGQGLGRLIDAVHQGGVLLRRQVCDLLHMAAGWPAGAGPGGSGPGGDTAFHWASPPRRSGRAEAPPRRRIYTRRSCLLTLFGRLALLQMGQHKGINQGQEGDDDEHAGDRTGEEGGPVPRRQHHGPAEVLFQNASQDQAQNNGRDRRTPS